MAEREQIFITESGSEKETEKIAGLFAGKIRERDIICFFGDVGSGKTVFTRGLCRGLGYDGYVNSPSYILMNLYRMEEISIFHFDLYRLTSGEELIETGFYDMAGRDKSVTIVEWAEILKEEIPAARIDIFINVKSRNKRIIEIYRVNN